MTEKRKFSPPIVGGSSLLVIFAVLCLVIFALLSLSTVRTDVRLAEKSREFVTAYYAADSEAQKILAQLRCGETPEGVTIEEIETESDPESDTETQPAPETETGRLCSYTCKLSSEQSLSVEVLVTGEEYSVQRWQVVSTTAFETADTITVWDGEQETEGE